MGLFDLFQLAPRSRKSHSSNPRFRPSLEGLESRIVPYSLSGDAWPNPALITLSFVPDGTILGSNSSGYIKSNLFSTFNAKFGSPAAWQSQILKAAQTWAQQTNLNFAVVADSGAAIGSGSYEQGDPNMGDIRIGGYNFGNSVLAQAYMPPPDDNYSIAGDLQINTGQSYNIGSKYDLFTVMLHEMGHTLGMEHSRIVTADMYANYTATKTGLTSDDITGIRSIYSQGLPRTPDGYNTGGTNSSFPSAADITPVLNASGTGLISQAVHTVTTLVSHQAATQGNSAGLAGVVNNLDITTVGQVEYFSVVVPSGTTGIFTVTMQSGGLSLLDPELTVYAADQTTVLAQGTAASGGAVTLTMSGVTPGQKLYLRAYSDSSVFGGGRYALAMNFGAGPMPSINSSSQAIAEGAQIHSKGGQANSAVLETQVNTTTSGIQQTFAESPQTVAMDSNGNYVVVWGSQGQDGSGWGIYGQRFDKNSIPQGSEFRVNTTTAGDQTEPTVAMDPAGDFVVTWQSQGQDGSGWGIYAQRFNAAGVAQGGEFRVNATTTGDQEYAGVGMDGNGNFVITWSSNGQDGKGWGIYAQSYNASGVAQGGEFRVNTTTADDQEYSRIAMDPNGDFVITWSSHNQDGNGWGIYAQRYSAGAIPQGMEFRVNTTTTGDQMFSSVAMDANGNFVIVWQSQGQDGSGWGVYGQRFNAAGVAQGSEFQVNATTVGDQEYATVAASADGSFMVTWSSNGQDGSGWGVYAQQYDNQGNALGSEFQVNTSTTGDQKFSSMAMDLHGDAVVVWSGAGAATNAGVFSQAYALRDGGNSSFMTPDGFSEFGDDGDTGGADGTALGTSDGSQSEAGAMLAATDVPTSLANPASLGSEVNMVDGSFQSQQSALALEESSLTSGTETKASAKLTSPALDRMALLHKVYDALFADHDWMSYT